ncbi:MAG: hypothetical protein LBQ39_06950 [Tannerellaceae bacterium]|jgi:sulfatase maturation enzyme AslB (radical SAM superfamily)|nr:hypothetical protein [Tannerellaceae bacterium]
MTKVTSAAHAAAKAETQEVKTTLTVVMPETAEMKAPTIEELKNRAVTLHLLKCKHDELNEKRKRLEKFAISHDSENASIYVTDADGEEFKSSSPKSIRRLIEFWKTEFSEAIEEIEAQMFNTLA